MKQNIIPNMTGLKLPIKRKSLRLAHKTNVKIWFKQKSISGCSLS